MSPTACPHGMPPSTCEICRVLEPTPVPAGRSVGARPARLGRFPVGVATVVIVAIVGFVVVGWVAAAFFAVVRLLELVAVAVIAGWVSWKLGVRHGRQGG